MDTAVSVRNIKKKYSLYKDPWGPIKEVVTRKKLHKDFYALNDVSLDFPTGESIGILGKNGSGKSTLLKIITGITEPTSGDLQVNGSIVFLDVSSGIDTELSGYENIFTKGTLLGFTKKEMLEKVDAIIEFSELGDYIDQPVKNYSSGMRSKLGFAISVNVDPDILIVDEALAVGDALFRKKCMQKMQEFQKQGKTIIFVSHDHHSVESFCSKAAWIHEGKVVTYGDVSHVALLYNDFMSGRKNLDSIQAELQYQHGLEDVSLTGSESGFSIRLTGYIQDRERKSIHKSFDFVLRDARTGEELTMPLEGAENGYQVNVRSDENSLFFKPGAFHFLVRSRKEEAQQIELALRTKNTILPDFENRPTGSFQLKLEAEGNDLKLLIQNTAKVEEQISLIRADQQELYLEGVAFVRGYETVTPDAVTMELYLRNRTGPDQIILPCRILETEEITENPSLNPQGKIYNFSAFHTKVDLNNLPDGDYEAYLIYTMNNEPAYRLINAVWASRHPAYPTEPIPVAGGWVDVKTASKYLTIEKRSDHPSAQANP